MALSDEEVRQVASAVTAALGKPGPMPNTASFLQWVAGILAGIVVTLIGTWIAMSGKAVSIDQVQAVAHSELLNPVTNPYLVERQAIQTQLAVFSKTLDKLVVDGQATRDKQTELLGMINQLTDAFKDQVRQNEQIRQNLQSGRRGP